MISKIKVGDYAKKLFEESIYSNEGENSIKTFDDIAETFCPSDLGLGWEYDCTHTDTTDERDRLCYNCMHMAVVKEMQLEDKLTRGDDWRWKDDLK